MYKVVVLILLTCVFRLPAQVPKSAPKTIRIVHADSWSFDKEKQTAQVLTGNVQCEHEGTLLSCDTALIYEETNRMVASGHIVITKGDSIRVTGDKLSYE